MTPTNMPEIVRIKQKMEEKNLTINDIAQMMRVTRQNAHKWFTGAQPLTRPRIEQMAEVLEVDPAWITYGVEDFDPEKMTAIVALVQIHSKDLGIELKGEQFAEIVRIIYTDASADASNQEGKVLQLLKVAS